MLHFLVLIFCLSSTSSYILVDKPKEYILKEDVSGVCEKFGKGITGTTLDNRFSIGKKLGQGSTGSVYELIDHREDKIFAIKFSQSFSSASTDEDNTLIVNSYMRQEDYSRLKLYGPLAIYKLGERTDKHIYVDNKIVQYRKQAACVIMEKLPTHKSFKEVIRALVEERPNWLRTKEFLKIMLSLLEMVKILHFTTGRYSYAEEIDNFDGRLLAGSYTLSHCDLHPENIIVHQKNNMTQVIPFDSQSMIMLVKYPFSNAELEVNLDEVYSANHRVKRNALLNGCQRTDLCFIGLYLLYFALVHFDVVTPRLIDNKMLTNIPMNQIYMSKDEIGKEDKDFWKRFGGMADPNVRKHFGPILIPLINSCQSTLISYQSIYEHFGMIWKDL
ncbi:hypothetical protein SNEBB_009827 [Seison nebaliae]|nr:hypothetical protein SNEBB_009827 [Seison nebaliae]